MKKVFFMAVAFILSLNCLLWPETTSAEEGMDSAKLKYEINKLSKEKQLDQTKYPNLSKLNKTFKKDQNSDEVNLLGELYEYEPNDDFPEANPIRLEDVVVGHFDWSQDIDVFKIQVNRNDDFFVLGSAEYSMNDLGYLLFDSEYQPVYPDEWVSEETEDIQAYYSLPAGTYYIASTDMNEYGGYGRYALMAVSGDGEESYENVLRIAGNNRYETAVEVSKVGWPDGADTVVLARDSTFPDALAGAPLAYKNDAPILLNPKDSLQSVVKRQIKDLKAKNVIILGGTSAITSKVERELKQMGLNNIKRIGGKNRYATAAKIAAEIGEYDKAVIAYGGNFPDALSVAPYAAANQIPILLSPKDQLPTETKAALKQVSNTIIVGGTNVISDKVKNGLSSKNPKRIAGKDRYDTSVKVAETFDMSTEMITVATGENFADALTGSVLAAKYYEPIILVKKNEVPSPVLDYINNNGTWYYTVLGGEAAISREAVRQLVNN